MGAQRWVDLGVIQLQPSEFMKIALVLALARYFHGIAIEDMGRVRVLVPPVLMILAPAAFVLRQPDLGTAVLLALGGTVVLFLAGIKPWKLGVAAAAALAAVPDRLAVPARLSEGPYPDLLQPGIGPARRRLPHPAVENRASLGRNCSERVISKARKAILISCRKSIPTSSSRWG